jgi:hypothetical protein
MSSACLRERRQANFRLRIALTQWHENADMARPVRLLGVGDDRPRDCRAADQANDLAPPHPDRPR